MFFFQVKYQVDGGFLGRREQLNFLRYLDDHVMYIDIFDGDTLFPVGSCGVELRVSFRRDYDAHIRDLFTLFLSSFCSETTNQLSKLFLNLMYFHHYQLKVMYFPEWRINIIR